MATSSAGIRKSAPTRKTTGSPPIIECPVSVHADAGHTRPPAGRPAPPSRRPSAFTARGAPAAPSRDLVLVDQEDRRQQLALCVEQVELRLRRDDVLEGAVDALAEESRHLRQLLAVRAHSRSPSHLAKRTRSSPSSMAAPTVSRPASTRGRTTSRR